MLQGGCKWGWELSWLPRVAAGGEALLQAGWHSSCPAGRGHGGHAAETVPAWGYFSECQFSALSLGSGCEAERGDSPSSRAKQSETEDGWEGPDLYPDCSQRCPGSFGDTGQQECPATGGSGPGGHHAVVGTGRAALSGTCASTQPPILQVGDWRGRTGAGRAEKERQPCRWLRGARSPRLAPQMCAHRPVGVHMDLHTHTCTGTLHTFVRTQPLLTHPHTHM